MQTADIIILVVLFLPALAGLFYGFLNILFSLAAWAIALGLAIKFGGQFAPLLQNYIHTELIRDVIAFVGLFIVSLMLLTALGYFIVKLLGRTGLTAADRILGFLFGIGLGGAMIAVAVFLAGFTAVPKETWWGQSLLLEPFQRIGVWAERFLPSNVAAYHSYDGTGQSTTPGRPS